MAVGNIATAISTGDVTCSCVCHVTDTWLGALVCFKMSVDFTLRLVVSTIFLIGNSPARRERAPF